MKKTKIAVIGLKGLPAFGGAATVGENIINELKDEYDFTVLSVSSHASFKNTSVNGVKQVIFRSYGNGGLNTFIYYIKCLLFVLFNKFDLIHLHHAESGFITPFLRFRYKVIATFHGVYRDIDPKFSDWQNKFFRFSEKLNVKYANVVVSVSKPDTYFIKDKYNKEIQYIPNGINIPEDIIKEEKDYISFAAGRIYQIKGLQFLLEALLQMDQPPSLVVAGDLDQVEDYKVKVMELSENLDVNYLGLVKNKDELSELIRNSKLFVFPSTTEAMSMMLLEVVSTRTPIIASDIPSNKAIFSDDEMLFFKSEDSEDLLVKLKYALMHQDIMKNKANLAFKKLTKDYVWTSVSNQYSRIYKNLTQ